MAATRKSRCFADCSSALQFASVLDAAIGAEVGARPLIEALSVERKGQSASKELFRTQVRKASQEQAMGDPSQLMLPRMRAGTIPARWAWHGWPLSTIFGAVHGAQVPEIE